MKVHGNGSIEQRGSNTFRLSVVVGYKQVEGKSKPSPIKKQKTIKARGTREARRILNQWIEEIESQPAIVNEANMALCDYLEKHIRDCETKGLSERTTDGYRQIATQRINPRIGNLALNEINPAILTDFYRELKLHGSANGTPLSAGTVKKTATLLGYALNRAVVDGLIPSNPNNQAEKFTGKRGAPKKQNRVDLEIDDMHSIIRHAKAHPNRGLASAIMIASFTGMRRAEICGLRWCDIDFDNGLISINHDLIAVKKKGENGKTLKLVDTKTTGSQRVLPMAKSLNGYLKSELARQKTELELYGLPCSSETPVIRGKYGSWIFPDTITTNFKSFIRDIGINPEASFKSLRSGVASLLVEEKVPVADVACLLGHASMQTTMRYYVKYSSTGAESAVGTLEEAYQKA